MMRKKSKMTKKMIIFDDSFVVYKFIYIFVNQKYLFNK